MTSREDRAAVLGWRQRLACRVLAWLLEKERLKLADDVFYDAKWVSGWRLGKPPSEVRYWQRRIAKRKHRVADWTATLEKAGWPI